MNIKHYSPSRRQRTAPPPANIASRLCNGELPGTKQTGRLSTWVLKLSGAERTCITRRSRSRAEKKLKSPKEAEEQYFRYLMARMV